MLLTEAELVALTRRDRPSAQARVLRRLGVPFRTHPSDGVLLVSRAAAEVALGAEVMRGALPGEYEVNVKGIRGHGTPAPAH
jgi:hypothetical protein